MTLNKTLICTLAAVALAGGLPVAAAQAHDPTRVGSVRELIAELPVAGEVRTGYERSKFRHWIDADKDGCNTRMEVLKAEAVEAPTQGVNCTLSDGQWFSYYDDALMNGASGLDIDHMVPLAESWDSGAYDWTSERRQAYANDLGWSRSLVAVTARTNRQKADQDPSTWMPPATDAQCHYVADWVSVKTRWQLSVDPAELQALQQTVTACPDEELAVPLA
ncbi:HNH endonuclease family protein [Streptomyces sp. NBC_00386]|uniref:HNH endonuclease family protein n=1 Tax=Streptomyces sp. NBC_00386 TaxID=2975734 RepID=UPI002E23033F